MGFLPQLRLLPPVNGVAPVSYTHLDVYKRQVDQGIAQVVILIGELNGWLIKHDTLSHPVAFGEGAGGDVPNDDFQGDNGHLFYHSLPVVQLLHQVSGNACLLYTSRESH